MSNFSHIFHSLWSQGQFRKLVLTIFDHIWRGLWWVWCSLILGGFIVGIVISVITTGTSGLADPNKWVIIHLLITHPFYTIIGLIVLSLISLLAYFAHHYQYSASQKNQHLHNKALVDIAKGVRTAIEVLGVRSEESLLPLKKDTSNPAKINTSPIWNVPYHRNPFFRLSVISWAKLMQNELILDAAADQTRLVHTPGA